MLSKPQLAITKITSRDNSLLRRARAARDGKLDDVIFVEGLRLCEEALYSGLTIEAVIYSTEIAEKERAASLLERVAPVADRLTPVSEKLLATISYTHTPQGIVALAARPKSGRDWLEANMTQPALVVVMHGINNPVNVGAILRTAEAASATGVIATATTSDPFSPKSLRGAMGSAFRLPIWSGPTYEDLISWASKRRLDTLCADSRGTTRYTQVDWRQPSALILGPESAGFSSDELNAATNSVAIPMHKSVESLNVAVAAGILLYEAVRQRQRGRS